MNHDEALKRVADAAATVHVSETSSLFADSYEYEAGAIKYLLSIGFASLSAQDLASSYAIEARQLLASDSFHSVVRAFEERLRQAQTSVPLFVALPDDVTQNVFATDPLDLLTKASRIIAPYISADPWLLSPRHAPWIPKPQSLGEKVYQLEQSLFHVDGRIDRLHAICDQISRLPLEATGGLLESLMAAIKTAERQFRAALQSKIVVVAEYAGHHDLARKAFSDLGHALDSEHVLEALSWSLPVAGRLGMSEEISAIMTSIVEIPNSRPIVATCLALLGDMDMARDTIDQYEARDELGVRRYAIASAQLPVQDALERLVGLSRFNLSTMRLVDTTVHALIASTHRARAGTPTGRPKYQSISKPAEVTTTRVAPPRLDTHQSFNAPNRDTSVVARVEVELDGLMDLVNRPRTGSPIEAPWCLTQAYLNLGFACELARIDRRERGQLLMERAHAELEGFRDPVHSFLISKYSVQFNNRAADRSEIQNLIRQQHTLSRVQNYIVNRLREQSPILASLEPVNAVEADIAIQFDSIGFELAELRFLRDGECESAIEALGSYAEAVDTERARLCKVILTFASERSDCKPFAVRRIPGLLEHAVSGRSLIAAMAAAATYDKIFVDKIVEHMPNASLPDLVTIIDSCRQALSASELTSVLSEVSKRIEEFSGDDAHTSHVAQLARLKVASGLAQVGSTADVEMLLNEAHLKLAGSMTMPYRIDLSRAVAQLCATLPFDFGVANLRQLYGQWAHITDSYSTNSHFCLSVVVFVETIGVALAQLAQTTASAR